MTPLLAATATDTLPVGWLALAALLWLTGYVLACWIWPFTAHGRCNGTGKFRSPSGRAWRPCRGCGGTGRKVRAGRKLWTGTTRLVERGRR
jgi:hypothetical protein